MVEIVIFQRIHDNRSFLFSKVSDLFQCVDINSVQRKLGLLFRFRDLKLARTIEVNAS